MVLTPRQLVLCISESKSAYDDAEDQCLEHQISRHRISGLHCDSPLPFFLLATSKKVEDLVRVPVGPPTGRLHYAEVTSKETM